MRTLCCLHFSHSSHICTDRSRLQVPTFSLAVTYGAAALQLSWPRKGKGRMVIKCPASMKMTSWKKARFVRGKRDVPA